LVLAFHTKLEKRPIDDLKPLICIASLSKV
jgi:hypothetical protein